MTGASMAIRKWSLAGPGLYPDSPLANPLERGIIQRRQVAAYQPLPPRQPQPLDTQHKDPLPPTIGSCSIPEGQASKTGTHIHARSAAQPPRIHPASRNSASSSVFDISPFHTRPSRQPYPAPHRTLASLLTPNSTLGRGSACRRDNQQEDPAPGRRSRQVRRSQSSCIHSGMKRLVPIAPHTFACARGGP